MASKIRPELRRSICSGARLKNDLLVVKIRILYDDMNWVALSRHDYHIRSRFDAIKQNLAVFIGSYGIPGSRHVAYILIGDALVSGGLPILFEGFNSKQFV